MTNAPSPRLPAVAFLTLLCLGTAFQTNRTCASCGGGSLPKRAVPSPRYTGRVIRAGVNPGRALTVSQNFRISSGVSNAVAANNPNEFGDYTGLAFNNGVLHPCWGDNSAGLANNPQATQLEVATASVTVSGTGTPTVGNTVNVSRKNAYQSETAIAVNPTNGQNLVCGANDIPGPGIFKAFSNDGGATWTGTDIATGSDGLPNACCDPSIAFDRFGNCFFIYLAFPTPNTSSIVVLNSTNGGSTFSLVATLQTGSVDQPTVVTGPGPSGGESVWVSWMDGTQMTAAGAPVTALGTIGTFSSPQPAPGSGGGNFGDIVIGPNGQVVICYQKPSGGEGPATIFANVDSDGLGANGFGPQINVTTTEVGGFDHIPPQDNRSVDAEAGLAYDRSTAHNGRLYLMYTDEGPPETGDTNIFIRYSDDDGGTWTAATRVNDDTGTTSQFNPKMALDQTTGAVGVTWYDCRGDSGSGQDDTDTTVNTDAAVWGAIVTDPTGGGGLAAPSNLVANATSATQIVLTWQDNSTTETGFEIERAVGTGTFSLLATTGADVTTFTNNGLTANTLYTYHVRAITATAQSAFSNDASTTTPAVGGPAAPSNLQATLTSPTQATLTWQDNSSNETGFEVEQQIGTGAFTLLTTTNANVTTYVDNGLAASTTFTYRVRAVNGNGSSGYSNTASVSTAAPTAPSAPSNLQASPLSTTQIRLTWRDNSNNEQNFRIERKSGTGAYAEIAMVGPNVTTYTDSGLAQNTSYSYQVRAFNSVGFSPYSNEVTVSTLANNNPPAAPTKLVAGGLPTIEIRLTWEDNSDNEAGFRIERKLGTVSAPGPFTEIRVVGANVETFDDANIRAGLTYTYRVRAYNAFGTSAYSNTDSGHTDGAPSAPVSLTAAVASPTSIRLNWLDTSENETGFKVERKTGDSAAATPWVQIVVLGANATSYLNTGLAARTVYTYRVRAYTTLGHSAYSNTATASTNVPRAPENLFAQPVNATRVRLTWNDVSNDERNFRVERKSGSAGFGEIAVLAANTSSYVDNAVQPNTRYTYRVRASSPAGFSLYSNEAVATTLPLPNTPGNVQAVALNAAQIRVSWTDTNTNESGYRVERKTGGPTSTNAFAEIRVTGVNATSITDSGRTPGTTYTYRVRAFSSAGTSVYSSLASATTPRLPAAPTNLRAAVLSPSQVRLDWTDNSADETSFVIERRSGAGTFVAIASVRSNTTAFTNSGLTPGTVYTYRVRAVSAAGNSPYSNEVQVTPQ